jgi:hypothetical protein
MAKAGAGGVEDELPVLEQPAREVTSMKLTDITHNRIELILIDLL